MKNEIKGKQHTRKYNSQIKQRWDDQEGEKINSQYI
jgi:hypothetical protein